MFTILDLDTESGIPNQSNEMKLIPKSKKLKGLSHSSFPDIMHAATKLHVMLRRFVSLTWMHGNKELL